MPQFLFDTDHLTLYSHGHQNLAQRIAHSPAGEVGLSVVSVEESLRGRLAAITRAPDGPARIARYAQLVQTLKLFDQFPIVAYDQASEDFYQKLLALRLRIGSQDLKIAAVALANHLVILTRNRRDFGPVPGLKLDDWSV